MKWFAAFILITIEGATIYRWITTDSPEHFLLFNACFLFGYFLSRD